MREMIDKAKNFKQFVNENMNNTSNETMKKYVLKGVRCCTVN